MTGAGSAAIDKLVIAGPGLLARRDDALWRARLRGGWLHVLRCWLELQLKANAALRGG